MVQLFASFASGQPGLKTGERWRGGGVGEKVEEKVNGGGWRVECWRVDG